MTQLGTPEFLELGDQEDNPIGRYWWDRLECHIKTSVGLNKAIIFKKKCKTAIKRTGATPKGYLEEVNSP